MYHPNKVTPCTNTYLSVVDVMQALPSSLSAIVCCYVNTVVVTSAMHYGICMLV